MFPKKPIVTAYLTLTTDMKQRFRSKLRMCSVTTIGQPLSLDNVRSNTEILAVFVDSPVTKELIAAMPHLKLIVTLSTGFDHIDVRAAKARGIPVCNVPSYGETTVAEYALGLMLSLTRNLFPATKSVKEGKFAHEGFRGTDIAGKTIGIIGTGRIGRHLINLLEPFGGEIIAYDPHPNPELAAARSVTYTTLPTLFRRADIISLHAPLTPNTHHIIDKAAIKKMKPGVFLINTARGALIDSAALVWGLSQGIVAGAALDVLEGENLLEDPALLATHTTSAEDTHIALMNNLLIDHPQTIITPHNAFNTTEAIGRIIDTSVIQIKTYIHGTPVPYDVTML